MGEGEIIVATEKAKQNMKAFTINTLKKVENQFDFEKLAFPENYHAKRKGENEFFFSS